MADVRDKAWMILSAVLVIFAVPWFLWGNSTIVAGLPIWLWWHIGWMVLAAIAFYLFTQDAWDRMMGVDGASSQVHETANEEGDRT